LERTVPELSDKLGTSLSAIAAAAAQMKHTAEEAQATCAMPGRSSTRARCDARGGRRARRRQARLAVSDAFKETSDGMLPIDSFEAQGKGRAR